LALLGASFLAVFASRQKVVIPAEAQRRAGIQFCTRASIWVPGLAEGLARDDRLDWDANDGVMSERARRNRHNKATRRGE
jgi:hypothetical protein